MIQAYSKITVGFVTQQYMLNREGKYICIEQFYTAGDGVSREDQDGDPVQIDINKEVYQTLDMEQPKETSFEQWYQENKHNDSVQSLYKGVVENDPDYSLCFKEWCKQYYSECVDVE